MKKIIALLIMVFSSDSIAVGGVPTLDIGTIGAIATQGQEQARRWSETVEQYKTTYKAQLDSLATQTGLRDIADFMKDTSTYFNDAKELSSWINNPQRILDAGFDSLSGDLKAIYKSYGLNDLCNTYNNSKNPLDIKQRKNCEGEIVLMTLRQQQQKNSLDNIQTRVETINKIANRMAVSKDQKESIDLGNAMNTQLTLLQAEKLKMDLQVQQEEQQQKLIEKREQDLLKQKMKANIPSNTGSWN
ncbi:type IV secretion system protein [Orbus wheelerorum]|uniref:type IV secretion system protein n=1 Tax=Orbus wheelerorum TaxID=3074111 RepID=UPI00370D3805